MPALTGPVELVGRTAPSRVLFGPHETNLGVGRAFSAAHTAYYARRAAGGAGVIVTEVASVHPSDWPYERAPLASSCAPGWASIAAACPSALVLAGLGHTGLQGSSAYSQHVLWAPSPFTDVITRETPAELEPAEIAAVIDGFATAAALARAAGLAGVEVDAGSRSLLRQFRSGLTNWRADRYGDPLLVTRLVLQAVRSAFPDGILALRLSCDEQAPWGGITPTSAAADVTQLAPLVDLITVVRGGPYSTSSYRPDWHTEPGFNRTLTATMRAAAGGVPIVLQGSVVDAAMAQGFLDDGVADLVELTRAQIADASLVNSVRAGRSPRPCVLCNQLCQVRDPRNPVVSCIGDPVSLPAVSSAAGVTVIGGGPAGLEAARTAAAGGASVRLIEQSAALGGAVARARIGRLPLLTDWLETECRRFGVVFVLGTRVDQPDAAAIVCTGSAFAGQGFDPLQVLDGTVVLPDGPVLVLDPVGGPVAVAVAERLAGQRPVGIVTPDPVVAPQLSRTGDLADANARLQRAGVVRHLRSRLVSLADATAVLADVWTGARRAVACAAVIDCGPRLPDATPGERRAGDCVAPRTVAEAIREGRRA